MKYSSTYSSYKLLAYISFQSVRGFIVFWAVSVIKLRYVGGFECRIRANRKRKTRKFVPRNRVRRHETTGLYSSQLIQLSGRSLYAFGRCVLSADTRDTSSLVKSADSRGNGFPRLCSLPFIWIRIMGAVVFRFLDLFRFFGTRLRAWFSENSWI